MHESSRGLRGRAFLASVAVLVLTACASAAPSTSSTSVAAPSASPAMPAGSPAAGGESITLYTSVTQDTIDAVLAALATVHPELHLDVFRAVTGQLDARIAAEQRSGGVKGDVLWATDPLSTAAYDAQGLLLAWTPSDASVVPAADHTTTAWGTRLLNLVMVAGSSVTPQPAAWSDLVRSDYAGSIAVPDPSFAGSAFAALGYFASTPGYGMDFYRALKSNGATQVSAIGDVITGVAQGQFKVGIALDKSIRDAVAKGSPITLVWPQPGAITLYSPVAVFASSAHRDAAETFAEFLLSTEGQAAIASTGWQPIRADVPWTQGGPTITLDWQTLYGRQDDLLAQYRTIFGG